MNILIIIIIIHIQSVSDTELACDIYNKCSLETKLKLCPFSFFLQFCNIMATKVVYLQQLTATAIRKSRV